MQTQEAVSYYTELKLFFRGLAGIFAGAVGAAVGAATLAVGDEGVTELFAGTMKANGEVVAGEAEISGDLFRGFALKIDALKQGAVLFGKEGNEPPKAFAEGGFFFGGGSFGQFGAEAFVGAGAGILAAVEIDDGAAKDSIEPGGDCLGVGGLMIGGDGLEEAFLDEIFGEVFIADALASELDEGVEVFEDGLFQGSHGAGMVSQ